MATMRAMQIGEAAPFALIGGDRSLSGDARFPMVLTTGA